MNLVEKLLTLDKGELEKIPTDRVKAKRLSDILGESVYVTVRAIPGDRYTELSGVMMDGGDVLYEKSYEVSALIAAEGVTDPDLKNPELQKHYGCASPKDLARKLFPGGDLIAIADKIGEIGGFSKDRKEEREVKNS